MFKSPNQRKFLFALDKDKQKSGGISLSGPQNTTSQSGTKVGSLKKTNIPSFPGLTKMPKFARVKKYFKKTI